MREPSPLNEAMSEAALSFVERLDMLGYRLAARGRVDVDADWLAGVFLLVDEALTLEPDAARFRATMLDKLVAKLSEGRT